MSVTGSIDRWRLARREKRSERERLLLARRVRDFAEWEREWRWTRAIVDLESLHRREPLYERIADRLEALDRPVDLSGVRELERFLAEPQPTRDDGVLAEFRDTSIEELLQGLDPSDA